MTDRLDGITQEARWLLFVADGACPPATAGRLNSCGPSGSFDEERRELLEALREEILRPHPESVRESVCVELLHHLSGSSYYSSVSVV